MGSSLVRVPLAGLALTVLATVATAAPASAQDVRGWAGTNVQMVELRPVGLDTIAVAQAIPGEDGTFSFDGRPFTCNPGARFCTGYGTRPEERLWAASEDVSFTAWGFGFEGLSFTGWLRGRARFGGDLVWPRSDDEVDIMLGYAQLVRGTTRIRLGRQELRTGLGFPSFDGAAVTHRLGEIEVEAYGGRSLARGLREPANEALRGLESFLPDESAYLFGSAFHTTFYGTALTGRYHREILSDRSSLVSERGSLDVSSVFPGMRVTASVDYDFGMARVGKSHLTASFPLRNGAWLLEATARRYVPYFELSTIWGFFQPVSYTELEVRNSWARVGPVGVWTSLSRRNYGDADATTVLRPLEDTGWRGQVGLMTDLATDVTLRGEYRVEWLPGGFLNSLDASVRWDRSERMALTGYFTSFQQIEEFRVGDGRAVGGGGSVDVMLSDRLHFAGGGSLIRHLDGGTVFDSPWSQTRVWSSLRVAIGRDPGLAGRRGR